MQSFTIYGRLPTLNEYETANRTSPYKGATMKREHQSHVFYCIKQARLEPCTVPIRIGYRFYEADRRRDCGNVMAFADKVTQDALQDAGILKNDSQRWMRGYTSIDFDVDKTNPRIEVTLTEVEEDKK